MNKVLKKFMWKHFFEYMHKKSLEKILSHNRTLPKF